MDYHLVWQGFLYKGKTKAQMFPHILFVFALYPGMEQTMSCSLYHEHHKMNCRVNNLKVKIPQIVLIYRIFCYYIWRLLELDKFKFDTNIWQWLHLFSTHHELYQHSTSHAYLQQQTRWLCKFEPHVTHLLPSTWLLTHFTFCSGKPTLSVHKSLF